MFFCRSSDSAKYGTNKSSGASVTSGQTKSSSSNTMKSHHHTVSSRKPPLCPGRSGQTNPPAAITQQPQAQQQQQQHQTQPHQQSKFSSVPGVHSANGSNSRLINTNNTHYQNNHYTFSLTRTPKPHQAHLQQQHQQQGQHAYRPHNLTNNLGGRAHPAAGGVGSIGSGLSTSTYLDTVATLSSSAAPYHYYYDGTGFRSNVGGGPGLGFHGLGPGAGSGTRGTKSDIGVPIRPKRHYQQQQAHQQQQQQHQYNHITSVHNFSRTSGGDRKQRHPMVQSPSFNKSIDYLENYKTGLERLNQGGGGGGGSSSGLNNNNPETFTGLLGMGATGSQNVLNNQNNNNNNNNPNGPWEVIDGTKGQEDGVDDRVGPLICFDTNRNQDGTRAGPGEQTPANSTPTRQCEGSVSNAEPLVRLHVFACPC